MLLCWRIRRAAQHPPTPTPPHPTPPPPHPAPTPGNETRVVKMLNSLSELGADVRQGRAENLHVSGHAYQEELVEVMR